MKKRIKIILPILLSLCLVLSACGETKINTETYTTEVISAVFASETAFSDRDYESTYEDFETITLIDGGSTSTSANVSISDDTITILAEGIYTLTIGISCFLQ